MGILINGKEYQINIDVSWKTQKMLAIFEKNPRSITPNKMEFIIKDMLIPTPSDKELNKFRKSEIDNLFMKFTELILEEDKEAKKKLRR